MIVPVPAGAQMDSIARIVAERMRTLLSQPIVAENATGASGTIGVGRVARAAADGYSLLYGA
jgi:tripartite-type tricarboxylate transporter receptor subunit TctC